MRRLIMNLSCLQKPIIFACDSERIKVVVHVINTDQ